ncbi:MAG: CheR family methyltransferase [Vulcanimicrobiota bacterium]
MKEPTRTKVLDDPDFASLKNLLIETTGLAYYRTRDEVLASKIGARMQELELTDCSDYLRAIKSSGATEMDHLISRLTIGETYFFRTKPHFDALEQRVFPELLARNLTTRRLSIWSAGCATGPEPYSLSLLLRDRMGARTVGWDLSILATDINQEFLETAARASYGQWAFRAISEEILRDCFHRAGKHWKLDPRYSRDVCFAKHNLVRDPFPPIPGPPVFDLIVCRNVLIYFNLDIIRSVVSRFYECLKPGGWLLVGHSEPNIEIFHSFETVRCGDTVIYQKPQTAYEAPTPVSRQPDALPAVTHPRVVLPRAGESRLVAIRRLTDEGRWQEALELCQTSLIQDALDPKLHFLLALIQHNLRQEGPRDESLKKALYLDRSFVEAHYYRGVFLSESGNRKEAGRSFRAVLRLLEDGSGASPGPEAPDQLLRMSRYYLDRLEEPPGG